ncbi:hypothetical protein [Bifidobacterium vansinderenii]|uniref:Uncharacterized protein n=1 Tax=Bifidobacterium vansinderenii TaxID=1984871 RepID=A0A229W1B3_9BIFI|nr:hypothetical protein [Bifidobacterium vansinderenii]OXN01652.1 hypothetical protein Tam10B_0094 [Bifidobacterium vansinderenii]
MPKPTDDVTTDILDEPTATPAPTPEPDPEPAASPAGDTAPTEPTVEGLRVESFETTRPDGTRVRVVRDIDTGRQTVEELP